MDEALIILYVMMFKERDLTTFMKFQEYKPNHYNITLRYRDEILYELEFYLTPENVSWDSRNLLGVQWK